VLPSEKVTDPKELYLAAFHLYREGHHHFLEYTGNLPNGIVFGDPEDEVLHKLGQPLRRGGGGASSVTNGPIPRWLWFPLGEAILHIQLDVNGRVEMVTPRTCDVNLARTY
jgi:hypothetical protein